LLTHVVQSRQRNAQPIHGSQSAGSQSKPASDEEVGGKPANIAASGSEPLDTA
jgi:hypothetical protein